MICRRLRSVSAVNLRDPSAFLPMLGLPDRAGLPLTFLCGAGISYPPPTSLPTVRTFIENCAHHCTSNTEVHEALSRAVLDSGGPPPRFEVLVNAISQLGIEAASIGALFDSGSSNILHRFVGNQCEAGAAIITTNFDNCIERTMEGAYGRVVFRGVDLETAGPKTSVIVKPHGSNPIAPPEEAGELVVSIKTLARTAKGFRRFPVWRDYLESLLRGRNVIVIGYSGSDDFDLTPVLLESGPAHIVWIDYAAGSTPHISDPALAGLTVQRFCSSLPSTYMRGDFSITASALFASGVPVAESAGQMNLPVLDDWLEAAFSSAAAKQSLLCAILRHYSLHGLTVKHTGTPLSAEAVIERGAALYYLGSYAESRAALSGVRSYSPSETQLCQASYLVSSACFYAGDTPEAIGASQLHVHLAEKLQDMGELQTALNHAAALVYSIGYLEEARAKYQKVLDFQEQYPSLQAAAMATWGLADIASVSGDGAAAIQGYTEARELCVQLGSPQGVAWMSANLGELLLRSGDYTASERHLNEAEALFTQLGIAAGLLHALACRARLKYCAGDRITARATLLRCVSLLETHLESPALTTVFALSYLLASDLDDRAILDEIRTAAGGSTRKRMGLARTGQAEHRLALYLEVLGANFPDERVYADCYEFIKGD